MDQADVVIVGGGFAGTAAAAALAGTGRRVVVLEACAGAAPRFRGELIHPHGIAVLERIGLLGPLLREGGERVSGFAPRLPSSDASPAVLLRYDEIPGGGGEGLAMDHLRLLASMRREVRARPGIEFRAGQRVVALLRSAGRVSGVRLAGGAELEAGLVVLAEGRGSRLREGLGFDEKVRLLSFTAALLIEGAELPHPGFGHVFLGAPGPVLAYGIGEGRVRMCVDLPLSMSRGRGAVRERLAAGYAGFVPEPLRGAMLRALAEGEPEICANHAISTRRCVAPGLAGVGDAGGCCHPLTASGMTSSLNDVSLLAEELDRGGAQAGCLERYERRRYRFVRAREGLADALYEVFRGQDEGTRAIREGVFRYWRAGHRARATSLSLLSGRSSSTASFLAEFTLVLGQSVAHVARGEGEDAAGRGRARVMSSLLGESLGQFRRTMASALF